MAVPHLRDERLAWLAIEPQLRRRAWWRPFGFQLRQSTAYEQSLATGNEDSSGDSEYTPSAGQPGIPDTDTSAFLNAPQRSVQIGAVNPNITRRTGTQSRRMMRYAVAVDQVSRRLNTIERQTLRTSGELPDWFLHAVIEAAKEIRI